MVLQVQCQCETNVSEYISSLHQFGVGTISLILTLLYTVTHSYLSENSNQEKLMENN